MSSHTAVLDSHTTLATWATTTAGASRVFGRHRLDYCCHGTETLDAACRRTGLDPAAVIEEIGAETPANEHFERWDLAPIAALIDHVLERYHLRHMVELPRLQRMAAKVEAVHRGLASCPVGLHEHLVRMGLELEDHMRKEEQVLFPFLRRHRPGEGAFVQAPIQVMEMEHEEFAKHLERTRTMTHDFTPPPEACGTWRALYLGLAEFEQEVMRHVHLENHVLFPRALNS